MNKKNIERILIVTILIGIGLVIAGIVWARTDYLAYVIRDKAFNWWSVGIIIVGAIFAGVPIYASFKFRL